MSTRSVIFAQDNEGILKGVYCHFDGYPKGVGATLHEAYKKFNGDFQAFVKTLVFDRPAGWSGISGWDGDINHIMSRSKRDGMGDGRYSDDWDSWATYHDDDSDPNFWSWDTAASRDSWIEFIYVLTPTGLYTIDTNIRFLRHIPAGYNMYGYNVAESAIPELLDKFKTVWVFNAWFTAWHEEYSVDTEKPHGFFHPLSVEVMQKNGNNPSQVFSAPLAHTK